jgi:hypothetical protein
MTNEKNYYEEIYGQEAEIQENPYGWIQWKGTDVCIDLHCECGHHGHFDGEFFYHFECPACHKRYAVGQNVKLIPLTDEQIQHVGEDSFKTCPLDDE